jgi:hypothetical protein
MVIEMSSPGVISITAPLVINLLLVPVFPQFNPETEKAVPALFLKDTAENQSSEHPVELVAPQICASDCPTQPVRPKINAINFDFVNLKFILFCFVFVILMQITPIDILR